MRFEKGKSGNPKGRPKGTITTLSPDELMASLKRAKAKNKGVSFLDNFCLRAYTSDKMAIALLRKMLPDLAQVASVLGVAMVGYAAMTPAQAAAQMDAATVGTKPKAKAGHTKKVKKKTNKKSKRAKPND